MSVRPVGTFALDEQMFGKYPTPLFRPGGPIARTDLFVGGAEQYSEEQIDLFDEVFNRLVIDLETAVRAILANRLAPIPNAPRTIIRSLAFDDSIEVAGPVLTYSERLDDSALIYNASVKGRPHLLAISQRHSLAESVTDLLVT